MQLSIDHQSPNIFLWNVCDDSWSTSFNKQLTKHLQQTKNTYHIQISPPKKQWLSTTILNQLQPERLKKPWAVRRSKTFNCSSFVGFRRSLCTLAFGAAGQPTWKPTATPQNQPLSKNLDLLTRRLDKNKTYATTWWFTVESKNITPTNPILNHFEHWFHAHSEHRS